MSETPVMTYARLLRQLHALMSQGQEESDEADAIRDQMDAPWYAMTAIEQNSMRELSEALYAEDV